MIRPYTPDDLSEVLDVWELASRQAHPFLEASFLDQERREIAQVHLPNAETWVWDREGRVEGFVALLGNEVGGLFVRPSRQGGGIGRALMDHARAGRPFLELGVFEANSIGRAFYDAYGFEEVGRRLDERSGQVEIRLRLAAS